MKKLYKERQVKLHPKYSPRIATNDKIVPWLTLSGLWLEKAGFNIGDVMAVTVKDDRIVVKRIRKAKQLPF